MLAEHIFRACDGVFAAMRLGAAEFGVSTPFTLIFLGVLWIAMMASFILICRTNVSTNMMATSASQKCRAKRLASSVNHKRLTVKCCVSPASFA